MSGLLSALSASAVSLEAFNSALDVTQNNVSNAATPGFASQTAVFDPLPFQPLGGPTGGVQFGGTQDLRNEASERSVQQQFSGLGVAEQNVTSLSAVESSFDISGQSGIDGALSQFFQGFSSLSEDPNNQTTRQQVITDAGTVVQAFQDASSSLAQASSAADQQIGPMVAQINDYGSQLEELNQQRASNSQPDPNLDASVHSILENLSELTNFTSSFAPDGTVSVLIGGQTPLVLGTQAYSLGSGLAPANPAATFSAGSPPQRITDQSGQDITREITGGKLAGLLNVRNTVLPGIRGDASQQGSLNQLAQSFADRVNQLLSSGQSSPGPPPVSGVNMFRYDTANPVDAAQSLSVTSITAQQVGTAQAGPPYSVNGIAEAIASLPNSSAAADQINGMTYTQFYGQIAADFGRQISDATTNQDQQTQALAQARNLRSQVSGVSLDEQASELLNFQRSYQAISKMVTVLNDLTQATIDLIR